MPEAIVTGPVWCLASEGVSRVGIEYLGEL